MAFQKIPNAKQGNFYGNRIIDILTGSLLFLFWVFKCATKGKSMGFLVSILSLIHIFRYAQKSIALQIKKKDGFLIISVEDDGIGFVDTEEKVTEPFYHKNPQDDLKPVSYTHLCLEEYLEKYK